jgi:nucleotide-binding universal stress UspA family protein
MIFTTIMVQLDGDSPVAPRVKFAQDVARTFEADLIAVVAAQAHILVPAGDDGFAAAEIMRQRRRELEDRFKILKEEFLSLAGNDERASWRAEIGDPTQILALHARAADLVITGAPAPAAAGDPQRTVNQGALILSAGRPVLFTADNLPPLRGEKVIVAWKDAREARRAVVDALPFLTNAKEVLVAAVAENDRLAVRDGAADVVRFLMKHDVRASLEVLDSDEADVASILADKAQEIGADLIVAGGYGHSRLREWAFGGATRSLLSNGSLHRLLSN